MIELERSREKRWVFQKNVSSDQLIEAFNKVLYERPNIEQEQIKERLRQSNAYTGRTTEGSLLTIGSRLSQMCFYMFGYKNSENRFIPTQTTFNIIHGIDEKNKNMLVNLFSIQYPHPYSRTSSEFKIYVGRLILKLLTEERIDKKLYIDEFIWFLPFIATIDEGVYNDLVESILEYRLFSYEQKLQLFLDNNDGDLFANLLSEMKTFFIGIFENFGVLELVADEIHNNNRTFSFKHGNTNTHRSDTVVKSRRVPGYVRLNPNLEESANKLLSTYSPFDIPTSMENLYDMEEWIEDLYENEFIRYLAIVFPEYIRHMDIINALADMTHKSKFGSNDGRDFENSLKPVFELFREVLNVSLIGGPGRTDLLCTIKESELENNLFKVNVDAKKGSSSNNLNAPRLDRHRIDNNSRYCIVVAPRFSRGTVLDLQGYPIVIVKAETLAKYLSKECLSNDDYLADYIEINQIITENLGADITSKLERLIDRKYGINH